MLFKVRKIRIQDLSSVLNLIIELAEFEKEPDAVEITLEDFTKDFSNNLFDCLIAENQNGIIGIALYYNRYSTWKGKTIHLEDLIVTQNERGNGVGKALLNEIVSLAKKSKVRRVEWNVLDWNKDAITFYEGVGANILDNWLVVQLDENGIKNY
ncbi:GNAT family N-acetyltransferase [Flavobacteriaceae bacterium]|nr:GNAT family N-acetyltransferase [Flavobacteriaceae bacterium]